MVNLLLCGNKKVFDGALTQLISITNRTAEIINCYIFTMNLERINSEYLSITDEQIEILNKVVKSKNEKNRVQKIDVTKLYNIDISGYEYAAVKEKYGCWIIWPDYINAGMLLFNMKEIKKTKLFEKARNLLRTKKMLFADQDAIYKSTIKKKIIPRIFNEQSKFNKKDTVICHFCKRLMFLPYPHTENYKQWHIDQVHKVLKCYTFDKDLEEYMEIKKKYNIQKENIGKE